MSKEKQFVIVDFDDGPQIIHNSWFSSQKSKVYWPNVSNMKSYYKAVENGKSPHSSWAKLEFNAEIAAAGKFMFSKII